MNKTVSFLMLVIILIIICFAFSCEKKYEDGIETSKISFKVDSILLYNVKNIPKNIFMFSPLIQHDKIWTINTPNPHELDLKTGEWLPLISKFGDVFKRQVREDGIWKDSYTGDTYISCFHDGLIRYYHNKDSFDFLKTQPVTSFYPKEKQIILGTTNGLLFFNRRDNKITIADNFPLDVWVNSIHELTNDTLIINLKNYFHIPSSSYGEYTSNLPEFKRETNYNYVSLDVKKKLPSINSGFREFKSDSISWYYKESELFYSKDNNAFFKFNEFPEGYVRHLLEDNDYLYVLYNDQFAIVNKRYIFDKSVAYTLALDYHVLKKELFKRLNELNGGALPFEEYLMKSIKLYKEDGYSEYPDLQKQLNLLPTRLNYFNSFNHEIDIKHINVKLESEDIPKEYKYNILKGLCRKYTVQAKLDTALVYFKMIKELNPSIKDNCIDNTYLCVTETQNLLDSLNDKNITNDEYLYLAAKAREKMIYCSCWFGESYYNFSIVKEKYEELLFKYPNSHFADDAEYWLISSRFYDDEEGGFPLTEIPNLKKFVGKYPNSNCIPDLMINIAYSYSIAYAEDIDERIKNFEKGILELENLEKNYLLDSIQLTYLEQTSKQILYKKNKLIFDLTIKPEKNNYKINEDIVIEVTLKNNSSTAQKITLFENGSYFSYGIHPDKSVKFIPSVTPDIKRKEFIIKQDESIIQKIKLNKLVRHWDDGKLGSFSFDKKGMYDLTCHSRENNLSSKHIKIYID